MTTEQITFTIDKNAYESHSNELIVDPVHTLSVQINQENNYATFNFSSPESAISFAKMILFESVYGKSKPLEFYPLVFEGNSLIVNGVRMTEGSTMLTLNIKNDVDEL